MLLECQPAPQSTYTGMCVYKSVYIQLCNDLGTLSDTLTSSALVPGHRIREDPELSQFLGTAVSFQPPLVLTHLSHRLRFRPSMSGSAMAAPVSCLKRQVRINCE